MQFFSLLASCLLVAQTLVALNYNATSFSCSAGHSSLTLRINGDDSIEQFGYFDGRVSWQAETIQQNGLDYMINARGASTIIADPNRGLSTELRFFLPEERPVTRVQTGGYYFPVFETYPFTFVLAVAMTNDDGSERVVYLDCVGT